MSDIFDLKARVSADATPFNKAMDSSATSVSSALSAIHNATNVFIGNGVIRTFQRATDAANEFGQVMADISSISDVGIRQLSKSIRQLDNVYGKMSNVGNSIYNMISSGFDKSEAELLAMEKAAAHAAKSIRGDLYTTTNAMTTLANAYSLTAKDFERIADLMFVTVKEGKAEGNELARTLGLVVNTASEAGLSLAEMSAVISTLSRTQTTSQAMIGFNQMLNAMIKPSKEAADTAKQFGIEFGAAALKSKGFTAIIKDMHDKLQGNVEAINKISGPIRAMRAVVSLTGKQYENFIDILEKAEAQIGTGVAMDAFAKQTDTAKQSVENLKIQLDKTFIDIGQDFQPLTKKLSNFSEEVLKAFSASTGIGKWSIYIAAIVTTLKTAVKTASALYNVGVRLSDTSTRTTNTTKTFADHMERAQRAAQSTAAAMNKVSASTSIPSARPAPQTTPSTAKATTPLRDGRALMVVTNELKATKRQVSVAQENVTASKRILDAASSDRYNALSKRANAEASLYALQQAKRQRESELRSAQVEQTYLNEHLYTKTKSSRYYGFDTNELQKAINSQIRTAQIDLKRLTTAELRAKKLYVGAEANLANAETAFQKAYSGYTEATQRLEKSKKILQRIIANESVFAKIYKTGRGNDIVPPTFANQSQALAWKRKEHFAEQARLQSLHMDSLGGKATAADAKRLIRLEKLAQGYENRYLKSLQTKVTVSTHQGKLLERFNRRFNTTYKDLEQAQRAANLRQGFMRIGAGMSRLARGLYNITLALAAWETGLVIGNAARKFFKLDDKFTSATTKKMEAENDAINVSIARQTAFRHLKSLEVQKKVNEAELSRLASTIALAKSQDELRAVQRKLKDKLEGKEGKEGKEAPTSYEEIRDRLRNDFRQQLENINTGPTGANARQIEEASYLLHGNNEVVTDEKTGKRSRKRVGGMQFDENMIKNLNSWRAVDAFHNMMASGKGTNFLDIAAGFVTRDPNAPTTIPAFAAMDAWNKTTALDVQRDLSERLLKAFSSANWEKEIDRVVDSFISGYDSDKILKRTGDRKDEYKEHVAQLKQQVQAYATQLKDIRRSQTPEEAEILREGKRVENRRKYANRLFDNITAADTVGNAQYTRESTKTYKERGLRPSHVEADTIDDAIRDLTGSHEVYIEQTEALRKMQEAYVQSIKDLRRDGVSEETIKKSSKRAVEALNLKSNNVSSAKEINDKAAEALEGAYDTEIKKIGEVLKSEGISETDTAYATQMRNAINKEIKHLDAIIAETTDDRLSAVYSRIRASLYDKAGEYRGNVYEHRRNLRASKHNAGMISESQMIRGEIADIQSEMRSINSDITAATKSRSKHRSGTTDYFFYTNQIANAQRKLQEASLRLRENFNKLAESTNDARKGLMNTIQGFTQQRDTTGKMTNDALWHSVNLASRMGGMVRSQPYMVNTYNAPNRQKASQMRQQAQGAVSASVDAWIMSQKYAEANVGKTVTDIFTFMKQNNTIVVRNK
jgi:TP901 family phage tail tape measure protein